jgi:hypothetical protein
MAIAAITKQGLWTMAILVAVLWGCLVGERLTVQRANREMAQVLQETEPPDQRAPHGAGGVAAAAGRADAAGGVLTKYTLSQIRSCILLKPSLQSPLRSEPRPSGSGPPIR